MIYFHVALLSIVIFFEFHLKQKKIYFIYIISSSKPLGDHPPSPISPIPLGIISIWFTFQILTKQMIADTLVNTNIEGFC